MERKNKRKDSKGNKVVSEKTGRGTGTCISGNGYVLIFSLWAIVIMGFVAVSFTRNTGIAIKTEMMDALRVKTIYAARGACIYAARKLFSGAHKAEEPTKAMVSTPEGSDEEKNGIAANTWEPGGEPYPVHIGDCLCDVFISDESGKININKITDDTKEGFVRFLTSYNLDEFTAEIITDSLLDWLDTDDLHHINGAEKQYYASLPEPYEPRNGAFESVEELTLVRGITPDIFEMIRNDVTIYGPGKININYASEKVLLSIPSMIPEMAREIIQVREGEGKIQNADELKEIFKHYGVIGKEFMKILNYITLSDSGYITIHSVSSFENVKGSYTIVIQKEMQAAKIIAVYPE